MVITLTEEGEKKEKKTKRSLDESYQTFSLLLWSLKGLYEWSISITMFLWLCISVSLFKFHSASKLSVANKILCLSLSITACIFVLYSQHIQLYVKHNCMYFCPIFITHSAICQQLWMKSGSWWWESWDWHFSSKASWASSQATETEKSRCMERGNKDKEQYDWRLTWISLKPGQWLMSRKPTKKGKEKETQKFRRLLPDWRLLPDSIITELSWFWWIVLFTLDELHLSVMMIMMMISLT